jgi:hypothetical protein
MPDDLTKDLPDREEWSDYERGADKKHRIAFAKPQAQRPVPWRGRSTCAQIDCDCGAVPVMPGIVGDSNRRICLNVERELRQECDRRGQTMAACPRGTSGPNAYPLPNDQSTIGGSGPRPPQPLTPPPPPARPAIPIPPR